MSIKQLEDTIKFTRRKVAGQIYNNAVTSVYENAFVDGMVAALKIARKRNPGRPKGSKNK